MNKFTINGVTYKAPPFDFNLVCDLEEAGVSLAEAQDKPQAVIRAYFAVLIDGDKKTAGRELSQHMINGGTFDELTDAMLKEMDESDFFRAITKGAETTTRQSKKAKKEEGE